MSTNCFEYNTDSGCFELAFLEPLTADERQIASRMLEIAGLESDKRHKFRFDYRVVRKAVNDELRMVEFVVIDITIHWDSGWPEHKANKPHPPLLIHALIKGTESNQQVLSSIVFMRSACFCYGEPGHDYLWEFLQECFTPENRIERFEGCEFKASKAPTPDGYVALGDLGGCTVSSQSRFEYDSENGLRPVVVEIPVKDRESLYFGACKVFIPSPNDDEDNESSWLDHGSFDEGAVLPVSIGLEPGQQGALAGQELRDRLLACDDTIENNPPSAESEDLMQAVRAIAKRFSG